MNKFDHSLKIGILGGGQLGRMIIQAAMDFDLCINCLDPDENAPCKKIANSFTVGDLADYQTVMDFGLECDLITIEIERVNIQALKDLKKLGKIVYPQPESIEVIQDKRLQKQFFERNNIPTSPFKITENQDKVKEYESFLPAVNKLAIGGYDGKGVTVLKGAEDLEKAFKEPSILEKYIDFEKELSVIVARNEDGDVVTYPIVEMVFHEKANLVDYLMSPAQISEEVENEAITIAKKTIEALNMVGLLAVEMFLTKDQKILVNEVAPRPHNSGHHTLKANYVSQFEQFLRAILNMPLGNTKEITPAAMYNLLGEDDYEGVACYEGLEELLKIDGVHPFLYGKRLTKPNRKMGHVTILGEDFVELTEKVEEVKRLIKVKAR